MPARLILNADDFGLTRGINRAVAELHAGGALSSATLMAAGPAFDDAVRVAREQPSLGVGCHVVLTDGVPLSDPASIPSLLGPDGKTFRPSLGEFFLAVLRGKVDETEVEREAAAQIERIRSAGIVVTHLDTHKHTHMLPGIVRPLLRVAERMGVGAIRNPFEQNWSLRIGRSNRMRWMQVGLMARLRPVFMRMPQIQSGAVTTTNGTIGVSATGRLDAAALRKALDTLPDGVWEVVCHPGYNDVELDAVKTRLRDSRDTERLALLEMFAGNNPHPSRPELIHYGDIAAQRIQS